jgi:dTDP-4-dehydrorhamnose reductase
VVHDEPVVVSVRSSQMNVLITGGTGYIGSLFTDYLKRGFDSPLNVYAVGSKDLDVRDRFMVDRCMGQFRPDVVLHLAAKAETEWCEDYFNEALEVNVQGSLNVVEAALKIKARVVYFSSACLYPDNDYPHHEASPMEARCKYTATKLLAEQALAPYQWQILNVRMRQPFSNLQHPRNILQKLATYSRFIDEDNSMSHLEECIPIIWQLTVQGTMGPVNITNSGTTSPYFIAEQIQKFVDHDLRIELFSYEELLQSVRAIRVNSLVDNTRLESLGFHLRHVEEAILNCLVAPCELGEYDWRKDE